MHQCSIWTHFSKECSADAEALLAKGPLHNPMTISEYIVCWHQQKDYFALFPPHGGVAQKISDNKIIELIYEKLSNLYEKVILNVQRNIKNGKPRRLPVAMKFNKMVAKSVKKSVKEIFETHMKTLKKCNRKDTNSNSDSENENYCMEDVGLNLEDVNASKTVALSDLCRPPQKCQKTNHLTPVTIVLVKAWLGNSRCNKIRILFI